MSETIKLLIVIVNYRATDLTLNCLKSISTQIDDVSGVRVAICENGTSETDACRINQFIEENRWNSWCWLKAVMPNRGFSGGNNVILQDALKWDKPPENFLLLNADTILRVDAIRELMAAVESNPKAGIVSPRLEWPDETPQISCFNFINPLSEFIDAAHTGFITRILKSYDVPVEISDSPTEPEWTTFACALIKCSVFQEIGLLDPGYFLYFDDPDFCRRARQHGWSVLNWPAARVIHLRGQSNPVKTLTKELKKRPSYFYASRARYFAKFYSVPGLWLTNILWSIGRILSLIREIFGHKTPHICDEQAKDIWTNWSHPLRISKTSGVPGK
ncbi:Rhamnosyltransferase WbbL [Poriferisphaera corsica]|uniref:Rhamnosyltransferase WbbL n=1 Tax=Poriferisphaera corsica TaxID=2528020 RepID=A0A517YWD2_9BACT|nr:glycosyltransferase family 2 protein [Poriferisphaera corsica]QDU34540.1 Rhamnosyltransferase WbbL [Poriferisphaera corsica]